MTGSPRLVPRYLLVALAMCCFAARAMAPAGYMPGSLADGSAFVPCPARHPGLGALLADVAGGGGHHHEHADSAGSTAMGDCSFGSASPLAAVSTAAVAHGAEDRVAARVPVDTTKIPFAVPARLHRPRGPPSASRHSS